MSSTKQVEANRKNANKSTGPQSPDGKATASGNSFRHGILSGKTLLADETSVEFESFAERIYSALDPQGSFEDLLVDRIVTSAWRLRRAMRIECNLFDLEDLLPIWKSNIGSSFGSHSTTFALLNRYETSIERSLYRALHEFQRLKAMRLGEHVSAPAILDVDIASHGDLENGRHTE